MPPFWATYIAVASNGKLSVRQSPVKPPMQQVTDWLEKLGMSEYAQHFADNDIDFSILHDLTDQDLKDLGVASLGHRRKILRAIAELDRPEATAAPAAAAAPPSPSPTPVAAPPQTTPRPQEAAGERRYLTVMFCDLVDSTGIAARLDAEEWRDLVNAYLDDASAAVMEMGGHVAKKLGDGLMALFGYPLAHENDAERAARAALSIQHALADLNRKNAGAGKPELIARIGLESGPAVVDGAGEIYGDVANIAARVQAQAEPGAVLITTRVQRQVAGLFVAEERGTHALKGVPEPTALFRLIRASGGGRRSHMRQLTPFVGRQEEMAMLMRRWERVRQGDGQLVLIVGEPGLGKSRLIEEFHGRLRDTPHTWLEWRCSQLLQNTPLHPIAEWGRQRFGGADVAAERRFSDLESTLTQLKLDPAENAPLLAPLLDIPLPLERAPTFAPDELRRRQLGTLTAVVMASARVQPLVLAIEDLHWADPTTLDVLRGIAERGALAPLLVVATTRPEFRPSWGTRSHHGTISLAPLDRAQVRDMVAELSARHALSKDMVEGVAARTGGVPLFVEEVTRLLLERGEQGGIQTIPLTLQQSLMARLDRLGPAREVARVGSVIGRGFSYGLLRTLAGMEDAALQAALEQLAEADILLVQGLPPDSDYRFKHALIQDAAYENLLKSRRQVLHRRVAEILRDRFPGAAATEPEVLAHHFTQAGLTDAAIEWWGKAGEQALRRSAFQEAISHLGKAIEMADKTGEGTSAPATPSASANQRLKLQTNLGTALMWSRGFGAEESNAAFIRAGELAAAVEDATERFTIYFGQWLGNIVRGELGFAREIAETFLREAERAARPTECGFGHWLLGTTCLRQGDFIEAQSNLVEALSIYDPERDREAAFRFGQDSGAAARVYLANTKWQLGEVGPARALVEGSVAHARETGHVPTLVNTYFHKVHFEIVRGDAGAARRDAEIVVELSQENALTLYAAWGAMQSAWASARLDGRQTGATELRQALAAITDQGIKMFVPFYQGLLAEIEDKDDTEAALTRIYEALDLAGETGEHWSDAFLHRCRGEILLKRDPANTALAEDAFLTAVAIAQRQKARSFELCAALSLAKLYQSTDQGADAHAALAPALADFLPTPELPEIEQAQTLLAALAETDEVKNATARQRQAKLQISYANALIAARGYGAAETAAAFARARELMMGVDDAVERFSVLYGLWVGNLVRGELAAMREMADAFMRDVEMRPMSPEAGVAHRLYALTRWYQGDYVDARNHLEWALAVLNRDRDRDLTFRFGQDQFVAAEIFLALVLWSLGEVAEAERLAEVARRHATESGQIATLAYMHLWVGNLEAVSRNATRALHHADPLLALCRERNLAGYATWGALTCAWARARLSDGEAEATTELQRALSAHVGFGNKLCVPLYQALLAEIEAGGQDAEVALSRVDEAIALTERTGERWTDAFLHQIRGKILLKRDPANTSPAEDAFLTALAIAQQQKVRSFELRAALDLARLYSSTGRSAAAHALLASALQGFSPTPEFPEIAEAQTLLSALAK
jgi:class 3 adenylate cyclase/predicted ATPase